MKEDNFIYYRCHVCNDLSMNPVDMWQHLYDNHGRLDLGLVTVERMVLA